MATRLRRRGLLTALAGGMLAVTACAYDAVYVPTEEVQAEVQGLPAARYPVPPEAPRGDVTVTSSGVVELEPRGGGPRTKMFHVSVNLSNDSDTGPWTFDGREQKWTFDGTTNSPALISSPSEGAPVMTVPPGQKRTLDLYFPPPPGVKTNKVSGFDLLWTVRTPSRLVAERTPFERREIEPAPSYYALDPAVPSVAIGLGFGWGPLWWHDPYFYPFHSYAYPPVVHYGVGPPYWYRGYGYGPRYGGGYRDYASRDRHRHFDGPTVAPPVPADRGFHSVPAPAPPMMPSPPHMSAPAAAPPPVPSQPQMSAPAPR